MIKLKKYFYESLKYVLRSYPVIRPYIKEVETLYAMTPEELQARNEKRFLEIFYHAYDKSPFYHRLYTSAGIRKEDITCLADIGKIPVVTKDLVKQYADEMLTVPRWKVIAGHTSGSTGTPLRIYESWPSIWRQQAYVYYSHHLDGFTYGQPLVSLRGHLDKKFTHLKVHISNTLFLSSYNININTVHLYHQLITKHHPKAIEGYPSSLYSLSLFMKEAGLKLQIPVAFTSSETLLEHQRKLIEQQLGTEIFDLYGMTEQTILLREAHNHNGYYEAPGYSINEYLEDGEICTSLINDSFPMIRYRSNDIIELCEAKEDNPQVIVKKIEGRKEDYIHCKDGARVMRLDFLFKGVKHVKMSQLIQERNGVLSVCIVPEEGFNELDKEQVKLNLISRIGENNIDYQIRLITENEIRYTPRGKFKYLINLTVANEGGRPRIL